MAQSSATLGGSGSTAASVRRANTGECVNKREVEEDQCTHIDALAEDHERVVDVAGLLEAHACGTRVRIPLAPCQINQRQPVRCGVSEHARTGVVSSAQQRAPTVRQTRSGAVQQQGCAQS